MEAQGSGSMKMCHEPTESVVGFYEGGFYDYWAKARYDLYGFLRKYVDKYPKCDYLHCYD